MAISVVLEFEDDEVAKELVAKYIYPGAYGVKVAGAFKRPTEYCRCSELGVSSRDRGFTMGRVFGWWVCSTCHKVTRTVYHYFNQMGCINLIPQEIRAKQGETFVHDIQKERSKYEWTFLNEANSDVPSQG